MGRNEEGEGRGGGVLFIIIYTQVLGLHLSGASSIGRCFLGAFPPTILLSDLRVRPHFLDGSVREERIYLGGAALPRLGALLCLRQIQESAVGEQSSGS